MVGFNRGGVFDWALLKTDDVLIIWIVTSVRYGVRLCLVFVDQDLKVTCRMISKCSIIDCPTKF